MGSPFWSLKPIGTGKNVRPTILIHIPYRNTFRNEFRMDNMLNKTYTRPVAGFGAVLTGKFVLGSFSGRTGSTSPAIGMPS